MEVIKLDDFPINPIQDQIYEIIPDKTKIVASTNRLFNKYPTRYISAVPRFAINAYSKAGETVLDPFCGSGTTAIEAMLLGRNAMSIDIDPFARLLIKVKTTVYSKEDIDFLDEVVRKIKEMSPDESFQYPIPGIPNIEKWFCDKSILWHSFFKYTIDKLAANNQNVKDYLYVVLSGIIRKVSNADEVSPKPYISTKYPKTPADPSELCHNRPPVGCWSLPPDVWRNSPHRWPWKHPGTPCQSDRLRFSGEAGCLGSVPAFCAQTPHSVLQSAHSCPPAYGAEGKRGTDLQQHDRNMCVKNPESSP